MTTISGEGFRCIAYGVDHLLYQKALGDGIAALRP